jgi:hypothetical protein
MAHAYALRPLIVVADKACGTDNGLYDQQARARGLNALVNRHLVALPERL